MKTLKDELLDEFEEKGAKKMVKWQLREKEIRVANEIVQSFELWLEDKLYTTYTYRSNALADFAERFSKVQGNNHE